MHGILPHSPLHAKNLAEIEFVTENGVLKENVLFVRETRVTAILSHILIGLSLLMVPYPINLIPISVLDGLFLFCAFSTLIGRLAFLIYYLINSIILLQCSITTSNSFFFFDF